MKLALWNIRGLNKPVKGQEVIGFLWRNKVEVMGVLEARVKKNKAELISERRFRKYSKVWNYNSKYNGRIWIIWDRYVVDVEVLGETQVMHCSIASRFSNFKCFCSFVYASNFAEPRRVLLENLKQCEQIVNTPRLLLGDFVILKSGGGLAMLLLMELIWMLLLVVPQQLGLWICLVQVVSLHGVISGWGMIELCAN